MNKKFLALSAIAATFLFSGCQKEKEVAVDNSGLTHTVVFTAEKAGETRTAIASEDNGYVTYKWISGDKERMHIYEKAADAEKATEGTITSMELANNGETATFYVTFTGDAPTGSVTYSATYGGVVSSSGHNPFIPDEQKPGVDTFDPDADALVADEIVKDGRDENPSFKFKMHRMASLNKMTLKGMPAGDVIESVTFESDQTHYGYAQPDGSFTNGGKKLVMKYTENNTVPASGEFPVYFTTAPVTDATFTVTVKTDKGRYVKESTKKISFAVGQVRRFGVDMTGTLAPEGRTFTLVESVNDLVLGSDIVIAANGTKDIAMSIVQNPNNRDETAATKSSDGKTLTITEDVQVFTLQEGTTTGSYAFLCVNGDNEGYIYAASATKNWLRTESVLDDNGSWVITISNKEATLTAQGENTRNVLKYNSGDKIFSCYASGQQSVYLYQAEALPNPGMSWSAETATATITSTGIQFTAPTLTLGNATGVNYSSSVEAVATINNEGAVTVLSAGTTVITASFAGNDSYAAASASYTLTVTDSRDKVATPTFTPAAGAVAEGTEVTISTTTEGATIYYTTDGTAPTIASTQGTKVTIDEAMTVKAIAVKENFINSDIASAAYTLIAPETTIAQVIAAQSGASVSTSGVVAQVNLKGFIITDGTDNIAVYQNASPSVVVGQSVFVSGTRGAYNNVSQISDPTVTAGETGQTVVRTPLTTVSSSNATGYTTNVYVSLSGTMTSSTNNGNTYYNISIAGSSTKGSLYQVSNDASFTGGSLASLVGKLVTVTGYVTGSSNNYLYIAPVDIVEDSNIPDLSISPSTSSSAPASWPADNDEEKVFTVTPTNGTWAITENTVSGWATVTSDQTANTITVKPIEKQASDNFTGSITVTLTPTHDGYSSKTATIYLKQAKYSSGGTLTVDFEEAETSYSDWTFTNLVSKQTGSITAHGDTCYGTTGGKATGSLQTKDKIASPQSLTCYISKQTTNTTSSTWYIQVSSDGSTWNDVESHSATSMSKGEWVKFSADLSSYSNVYVRIYYSGSTAVRNIDDVTLTY